MEVLLSVVLPLRNDVEVLQSRLAHLLSVLDELAAYEVIVVDNGSSAANQLRLQQANLPVRLLQQAQGNIGRAQRLGVARARGSWVYLLPIDEFQPEFLPWAWRHRLDYDLILGSKGVDPTRTLQSPLRRCLSWGLNALLQLLCQSPLADTHGQKLLYLPRLHPVLSQCQMDAGLWETELVLRALRTGLRLAEIPVAYRDLRPPRNSMLEKVVRNGWGVVRLARLMKDVPWAQSPQYRRFCSADTTGNPTATSSQGLQTRS